MALQESPGEGAGPFAFDAATARPAQLRRLFRSGAWRGTTANMANGYTQGNLAILPAEHALDFARYCQRNPAPCPLIGMSDTGDPRIPDLGADLDIRTDLPSYNIYRDGRIEGSVSDVLEYWRDDSVAFVLGCSLSFEEALMQAGVPLRHIETGRTTPMYRTSIETVPAGPFRGGMVVSMRPMPARDAIRASAVTARFPHTHGMPVHLGDPAVIGIADIEAPDWGEAVPIHADEIPVFWACGVTPQNAIREAGIPLVLTHTPGSMLISDIPSSVC